MNHFLDCPGGSVRVMRGISHDLATCSQCGAQSWVNPR